MKQLSLTRNFRSPNFLNCVNQLSHNSIRNWQTGSRAPCLLTYPKFYPKTSYVLVCQVRTCYCAVPEVLDAACPATSLALIDEKVLRNSKTTPFVQPKPVWTEYSPPPPPRPGTVESYCN